MHKADSTKPSLDSSFNSLRGFPAQLAAGTVLRSAVAGVVATRGTSVPNQLLGTQLDGVPVTKYTFRIKLVEKAKASNG